MPRPLGGLPGGLKARGAHTHTEPGGRGWCLESTCHHPVPGPPVSRGEAGRGLPRRWQEEICLPCRLFISNPQKGWEAGALLTHVHLHRASGPVTFATFSGQSCPPSTSACADTCPHAGASATCTSTLITHLCVRTRVAHVPACVHVHAFPWQSEVRHPDRCLAVPCMSRSEEFTVTSVHAQMCPGAR